ncbi:MAG: NAD(P)H-dependent oxidoreductase [Thermoplasmata archaeon]|uniref:NAD(P)H-dependent oxidoreductase n=1 Tax=Candidatus Sysuiplasma superficiale TaxID=2823368 RepID=A0A8J8CF19_9ARCH|nr:NAD(P)H-dependent oxidoreductase [Candidatus Sysuiplasma superficiale]MBX8643798.1 NAD(P)H-dependent oxidoreductase [Candidatus Sysuiplasma superficiale]MCL4346594.1 NAD(P)H-dependent oxidoreductase [Candidatus Thermoplasmatota archaeon]
MNEVRITGFGGSLRRGSYNRMLLNSAKSLMPEGSRLEIAEISAIPLFNQDLEANPPEPVRVFKKSIKDADGVLIVTPEYNYSIPGFLKNAIDWASRPYGDSAFEGKPVAMMSAGGRLGGARAQYHLRQVFVFLNMKPVNLPEVFVMNPQTVFDGEGRLKDERVRENISELLSALVSKCRENGAMRKD